MAKRKTAPASPEVLEIEDFAPDPEPISPVHRRHWWWRGLAVVVVGVGAYALAFELTHYNKIYPGVTANGLAVAGLSREGAVKALATHTRQYTGQVLTITQGNANLRIPVAGLEPTYDNAGAAQSAYEYGRNGSLIQRLHARLRSALGHTTVITSAKLSAEKLSPYLTSQYEDTASPVKNASLSFSDNRAQVGPAEAGRRLDMGLLARRITERVAATSAEPVVAPVYELAPTLGTEPLEAAVGRINTLVAAPITLTHGESSTEVDQATIISWVNVSSKVVRPFMQSLRIEDLYPAPPAAELGLDPSAVSRYVSALAGRLDQTPRNADLAMQDGKLVVTTASRTGVKLDQAAAVSGINNALKTTGERRVTLKLASTQADVNEGNLESLGIRELISEGETYFPGSPSTRLINVRAGANRFNGVLLKPGQTFSFGELLGEVGPQTGYVPELVIIGNHEEKQYGGGLCQVSSTAFRAALAAGLPITQRHNHSFAISYYTWPYAAPGVDATIYYPDVDFKFVNDTGHYILMQTIMSGYDLKFQFFGTKTKSGVLRGPTFLSGSIDHTKPSHTVFYRDVVNLEGKVVKTDTFHTYYKSSLDFPIVKQFN